MALPLSNWARIATNQFDAGGTFTISMPAAPTVPRQFFRLQLR
jgi:hypothetical protein